MATPESLFERPEVQPLPTPGPPNPPGQAVDVPEVSLRNFFAGLAMNALLERQPHLKKDIIARIAYETAESMLEYHYRLNP